MEYRVNQYYYILIFVFTFNNSVLGQNYVNKNETNNSNSSLNSNLDFIKICKWKDDARTCLVFTFYDNCKSHKKISEIFDQYGFKSTFFVISSYMYVDSLKDICARGHEIGNHTFSHPYLALLDSMQLDTEIRKSKEIIENTFGIKCVSFAEPFSSRSPLSIKIALKNHLFLRDYPEYTENKHIILTISPQASIVQLMSQLKMALKSSLILEIEGHGMDGDGYEPISKELLVQGLDSVKHYVDRGDVWVTTYKEGGSYENLFHELSLEREQRGDTIILNFKNYNKEKYRDLDALPISIEIPYILSKELITLTDSVLVKKAIDKYVLTVDLKRDTSLVVVLKGYADRSDSLSKMLYKSNFVYPNPVKDILHLRCVGKIVSVEVYNMAGSRQLNLPYNVSKIDVSQFAKGTYFIKVVAVNGISKTVYKDKFLKII